MQHVSEKLDTESIRIIALTKRLSAELGCPYIWPEAFAVAMLTYGPNTATRAVEMLGGNVERLLGRCRELLQLRIAGMLPMGYFKILLDGGCWAMLHSAETYRANAQLPRITLPHLLCAMLKAAPKVAVAFSAEAVHLPVLESAIHNRQVQAPKMRKPKPNPVKIGNQPENGISANCDALAEFCVDLTGLAEAGRLSPVIGRQREIARTITTLCRQKKRNALLVGSAGTGKTCIVEGVAQRIVAGNVPPQLAGRRIYSVDLAAIVAGTQFRGQFEERMQGLLDAVRHRDDVILFFDEAHMIVGAGAAQGTVDASNILKPALARGEIACIGATTESEYRKIFMKDKALDRRFQRIPVDEPSPCETIEMLRGLRGSLEKHHGCTITDAALEAAVEFADRHITDRFFPDKGIDVIDEMCACFGSAGSPLGREQAAQIVADQIGVPIETVLPTDGQREQLVADELRRCVAGQEAAIEAVTRSVRRAFSPLRDPQRPLASLLFAGPSSVGKSYVAQIISRTLYANTPLIRIDMAEYSERHSISRLIGAPPGYLGHGDGNQLTDPVRRNPHAVVLLDNLDKAHPEVITALMEMLDTGVLTDGEGTAVNFCSTFIIMTTVAGAAESSKAGLGFVTTAVKLDRDTARQQLIDACRRLFGDEFVNRIDEFVPFAPLGMTELRQVAAFVIETIRQRLVASGLKLRCDGDVLDRLARTNARAVRAAVKNEIEPLVCGALADRGIKMIRLCLKNGQYSIA